MPEQQIPDRDGSEPERPASVSAQDQDAQPSPESDRAEYTSEAGEEVAQARIAELEDGWQRVAAELDNFRKRCARDLARARQQERARTAARWLPVVDNLERALEHALSDPGQIIEGVRAVHQQALSVLAGLGFPKREDTGRPFDPALHEAIGTTADEKLTPGTVARVVRPGYGSDEEILRPAAVVVATRTD
jgi:molecular chaperone GrpE